MERIVKSTPAEHLHDLIARSRQAMLDYQALGEDLLASIEEDRMNDYLEQLPQPAGGASAV
jgi:hypothetical protein